MLLKFKDTNRKCFYWLQEPSEEKDEEFLKKVCIMCESIDRAQGGRLGTTLFKTFFSIILSVNFECHTLCLNYSFVYSG